MNTLQLADLPTFVLAPAMFIAILYWMVKLNPDFDRFLICMAAAVALTQAVNGFGSSYNDMYRVSHLLIDWVALTWILSVPLSVLMRIWQKWLIRWARWWNTQITVNPKPRCTSRWDTLYYYSLSVYIVRPPPIHATYDKPYRGTLYTRDTVKFRLCLSLIKTRLVSSKLYFCTKKC